MLDTLLRRARRRPTPTRPRELRRHGATYRQTR